MLGLQYGPETKQVFKNFTVNKVKVSSYIAQYSIFGTAQSTLHIYFEPDMFNRRPSQLLWEASSHMLQLMCEDCLYTYPPLVYEV